MVWSFLRLRPLPVAVENPGNLYAVDARYCRVEKAALDEVFITQWGKKGDGDGEFGRAGYAGAEGIAMGASGNVYVADAANDRMQKFTSEGTMWR